MASCSPTGRPASGVQIPATEHIVNISDLVKEIRRLLWRDPWAAPRHGPPCADPPRGPNPRARSGARQARRRPDRPMRIAFSSSRITIRPMAARAATFTGGVELVRKAGDLGRGRARRGAAYCESSAIRASNHATSRFHPGWSGDWAVRRTMIVWPRRSASNASARFPIFLSVSAILAFDTARSRCHPALLGIGLRQALMIARLSR